MSILPAPGFDSITASGPAFRNENLQVSFGRLRHPTLVPSSNAGNSSYARSLAVLRLLGPFFDLALCHTQWLLENHLYWFQLLTSGSQPSG